MSKYLTPTQTKGFLKAGDVVIPGGDGFPSFSKSGLVKDVDRMLDYMTDEDRSSTSVESAVREATEDYSKVRLLEALNRLTAPSRERPSNVLREIALEIAGPGF